jgi:DNA helicase-2/ATP-dependent DNA helicase PcrA
MGDRHVYAQRTRFIPDNIVKLFETRAWPPPSQFGARTQAPQAAVDVRAKLRRMWG